MLTGNKHIDMKIFLEIKDLTNVKLTCDYFLNLCESKDFWRLKLKKDFPLRSKYLWGKKHLNLYQTNPEKLYQIVNQKSFIYNFFDISINEIEENKNLDILRGDVVHIHHSGNIDKFIWNGEKFLNFDDYGNIPKEFSFPEFSLEHFQMVITHNEKFYLSENSVKEAIENFDEKRQETKISDNYNSYPMSLQKKLNKEEFTNYIKENPYVDKNFKLSLTYIFCLKRM